jgi:hypothetical protein
VLDRLKDWLAEAQAAHPNGFPKAWFADFDADRELDPDQELIVPEPLLLPALLRAVQGLSGTLQAGQEQLQVVVPSEAIQEALRGTAGVIALDATAGASEVQALLTPAGEEVTFGALRTTEETGIDRIRFVQIRCLGRMSAQRGALQLRQRDALIRAIETRTKVDAVFFRRRRPLPPGRTPTVAVLDYQKFAKKGWLHWFVDHRGSNAARSAAALIVVGLPRPNMGAAEAEFKAANPGASDAEFQESYRRRVGQELIQAIHRLRPIDLGSDDRLVIYLLTNDDLSGMGFQIEQAQARDFSWRAGGAHWQTLAEASRIVEVILEHGERPTQRLVAQVGEIPRRTIGDALKALGMSWKELVEASPRRLWDGVIRAEA